MNSISYIEELINGYGYFIILFGTYFDHYGVPIFLVFGAISASQGLLDIFGVLACGFAGGWIGDLFLYFLGYKTGIQYWMQFSFVRKCNETIQSMGRLFRSHPVKIIILGRFLFAISKLIPPFAGMIRYQVRNYVWYSFFGNVLFSIIYTTASFYLGNWILNSQKELKVSNLLISIAFIGLAVLVGRRYRKKISET